MTRRFTAITLVILASVLVWSAVAALVMGDSRQTCEQTISDEVCAWELR